MNDDNFEKRLEQQPMRRVPHHWREEILAAARAARRVPERHPAHSGAAFGHLVCGLKAQLSALLWPAPRAWACLAGMWLAILMTNYAIADRSKPYVSSGPRSGPEMVAVWREQQRLLAELIEQSPRGPVIADRTKTTAPRPRSERGVELLRA